MLEAMRAMPELPPGSGIRCRQGAAVTTPAFGELRTCYSYVVHAVAPDYAAHETTSGATSGVRHDEWRSSLLGCFLAAFGEADAHALQVLAVPMLGAGARGAPLEEAASVAAEAAATWRGGTGGGDHGLQCVRFAVQEEEAAESLAEALDAWPVLVRKSPRIVHDITHG